MSGRCSSESPEERLKNRPDQLVVRRHSRLACNLDGSLRVGEAHSAQIAFSRTVVLGDGSVPVTIVDCSEGGLGIHTGVYLPKGTDLLVSFAIPGQAEHQLHLRIRRSDMVARTPTYYLGTSFLEQSAEAGTVAELLAWAIAEQNAGDAA